MRSLICLFQLPPGCYHNSAPPQQQRHKNDPKLCRSLHLLLAPQKGEWDVKGSSPLCTCEGRRWLWGWRAGAEISQGLCFRYKKGGQNPLMWRWSCVLMRLVTLRSVPARQEVASPSGSQPAKTLLLFSLCTAGLHRSQPATVLCGGTSTFSIIHQPGAPTSKHWPGSMSAAIKTLSLRLILKADTLFIFFFTQTMS